MSTRAEQRKLRQLEIEKEQRLEDDEALKMTEEQHESLLRSFQSVKFEFYDLDGLSWTDSVRRQYSKGKPTFAVLSKADLASFSPEDTIRVSAVVHTPAFEPEQELPQHITLKHGKRDGTRVRSPIKGLFSISDSNAAASDNRTDHLDKEEDDDDDERTLRLKDPPAFFDEVRPPAVSVSSKCPMTTTRDAGIITSIFRSPVFSPKYGRITCSSPSLTPIANFASP